MHARPVRLLVAIATLVTVTGCTAHGAGVAAPSAPPATPVAVSKPVSGVGPDAGIPDSAFAGHRAFQGPAAVKYGEAALRVAYQDVVRVTFATGWNPALLGRTRLSTSDFTTFRQHLTPRRRAAFDATVAKAAHGDPAALKALEDIAFFGVTGHSGLVPVRTGALVTDRRFTDASAALDRQGRLVLSFATRADLHLTDAAGRRYVLPTARTVRWTLTGTRLIDDWTIDVRISRPRAGG